MLWCALLINQAGILASAPSFRLCATSIIPAPPATSKPANSVVTAQGSGVDSVLFARTSHSLHMGFAWASHGLR